MPFGRIYYYLLWWMFESVEEQQPHLLQMVICQDNGKLTRLHTHNNINMHGNNWAEGLLPVVSLNQNRCVNILLKL